MPNLSNSSIAIASAGVLGLGLVSTMGLFGKNHMPVEGKTILVTGASEGMGRSVARQFAELGANVIIVSRSVPKLKDALAEMKAAAKSPSQRLHYISADVSVPNFASKLVADAIAWNNGKAIDIVWAVAGMSTPMLWAEEPALAACRRNMDVNFWGAAELSHAILREWLRADAPYQEPKHLIFTASVLALFPVVGYGPYNSTKAAVRALADTLAQEVHLYPSNPVKIHVVFPATILSPGFEVENRTKPEITLQLEKGEVAQTPDEVAQIAIKGLQAGKHFVTVTFLGELIRLGAMSGSVRNNWFLDSLGAWLLPIVWFFVHIQWFGDIKKYAKKHGHPGGYSKKV